MKRKVLIMVAVCLVFLGASAFFNINQKQSAINVSVSNGPMCYKVKGVGFNLSIDGNGKCSVCCSNRNDKPVTAEWKAFGYQGATKVQVSSGSFALSKSGVNGDYKCTYFRTDGATNVHLEDMEVWLCE